MRSKKLQIFFHSNSGLGGHFQHYHSGADCLDIAACRRPVELNGLGQIHLGDYRDIGAVENGWVLERFVLAFSDGDKNQPQVFP